MNTMSISRRKFAQLLGIGAAAAVVRPAVSFAKPTQSIYHTFNGRRQHRSLKRE